MMKEKMPSSGDWKYQFSFSKNKNLRMSKHFIKSTSIYLIESLFLWLQRKRKTKIFIHQFAPQMHTIGSTGPGESQRAGSILISPRWETTAILCFPWTISSAAKTQTCPPTRDIDIARLNLLCHNVGSYWLLVRLNWKNADRIITQ